METETSNADLLEEGDRGRPATSPTRRSLTVSSFKHGHNGRRTKLTNGLLRAISHIIEDIEILSISHLNQELLARGHSLSRSTVFRAMEILGMRMDRDKKRWCIGGLGVALGAGTRERRLQNAPSDEPRRQPSTTLPRGRFDEQLLCETNDRGMYIYNTGKLELTPSQYSHTLPSNPMSSTHHRKPSTSNHDNLLIPRGRLQSNPRGESTAEGVRDSTPVELSSATKRFIDSHTKTVQQHFPKHYGEGVCCAKTSGLHQKVSKTFEDDGQTPSTTGRQHACDDASTASVTSVLSRSLETGRSVSRKRKSDCPAKITPTCHAKGGRVKRQSWGFTPQGSSTVCGNDYKAHSYSQHEQVRQCPKLKM